LVCEALIFRFEIPLLEILQIDGRNIVPQPLMLGMNYRIAIAPTASWRNPLLGFFGRSLLGRAAPTLELFTFLSDSRTLDASWISSRYGLS